MAETTTFSRPTANLLDYKCAQCGAIFTYEDLLAVATTETYEPPQFCPSCGRPHVAQNAK